MSSIPPFEHTEVDAISVAWKKAYDAFHSHKTKPIEWRLVQLRKLYWGLKDNLDSIVEACKRDLGKSFHETYLAEAGWCLNDIVFMESNLAKWAKDESPPDIPLMSKLMSPKVRKDPLGVVLVIGAYNYPFQLSLGPMIGAIAAGCSVVLKPSESAPNSAAVMQMIIEKYLDTSAFHVVQGAVPETQALLDKKWDLIFYTGSATVGTIIAKKAAETLTPVILELGGKNPAIITKRADVHLAARRTYWTKVHNAGQICVSQNYILIDREVLPLFIQELKKTIAEFFPNGAKNSPDYGRIVNNKQFKRLKKMIDDSKGKILIGGEMDEKDNFIEPTVVQVDDVNDSLIVDESFGPIIPIYPVKDLDEAIRTANEVSVTPLGVYAFGTKAETTRILNETRSGGASVNDAMFHASIPTLEFGGVGSSGQGAYRGKSSFDAFTHRRAISTTPAWVEKFLAIRYPPYKGKTDQFRRMNDLKPSFDRNGRKHVSLLGWIFGPKVMIR